LCPNCFQTSFAGGKCPRCGYNSIELPQNALVLPPGTLLDGQYIVGRVLGIGGFGITYLAMHATDNKLCAIKEYFPTSLVTRTQDSVVSSGQNQSTFRYGLKTFMGEAATLKQFIGEPLIVQIYHAFQENGTAYFAMEYLDGVNARALTKSIGRKIPYRFSIEILLSVSEALLQVHRRNLLHRDVSPENIFITRDGQVKLIDFGTTRYFVGEKSQSLSVVFKPGFTPPEQYSSRGNQGPWSDIYALAATFYYISSGQTIPDALDRRNGAAVPALADIVPGLSPAVSEVIDIALRMDYRERFQTVDNFLGVIRTEMRGPAPQKRAVREARGTPYLLVISGRFKGTKWALPSNMELVIGRSPGQSNIVLDDPNISRTHCTIRFDQKNRCFYVKDASTNGTYNEAGQRFTAGSVYAIAPESLFYVSSTNFMIKVGLE